MKREEMLAKLSEITAITTDMVFTYDMGIQFDVMTSRGVCTNIGNVGNWPCYKMPVTPELVKLKEKLVETGDITTEDVLAVEVCKIIFTYTNMYGGSSWVVKEALLEKCVANLKTALLDLDTELDAFYAYVDLEEWNDGEVVIFNNQDDMTAYFGKCFGSDDTLYEDMDDEELESVYQAAEEKGWNSVAYKNFVDK